LSIWLGSVLFRFVFSPRAGSPLQSCGFRPHHLDVVVTEPPQFANPKGTLGEAGPQGYVPPIREEGRWRLTAGRILDTTPQNRPQGRTRWQDGTPYTPKIQAIRTGQKVQTPRTSSSIAWGGRGRRFKLAMHRNPEPRAAARVQDRLRYWCVVRPARP